MQLENKTAWIIQVPPESYSDLRFLFHEQQIDAVAKNESVWLRIPIELEHAEILIGRIRHAHQFLLDDNNDLFECQGTLPTGKMELSGWRPLNQIFNLSLPPASREISSFGAPNPTRVQIGLKRSDELKPINICRCSLDKLADWVDLAPECRMNGLSFAVNSDGTCFVKGKELPPITDDWFYWDNQVAVKAGFTFDPEVSFEVVRKSLRLHDNQMAVIEPISADTTEIQVLVCADLEFVAVNRSAVRLTQKELDVHEC